MEEAWKEARKKISLLGIKMKSFTYHDINEFTINRCETKIDEMDKALENAAFSIIDLFENYESQMSQKLQDDMNKNYQQIFDDVQICRGQIAEKALEIRGNIAAKQAISCETTLEDCDSSFQSEKLELLKRQVAALELANQNAVSNRCSKDAEASRLALTKRNAAIKKGVAKYECIMDDVTVLEEKIRKVHNWSEISDLEVGRYMYEIKDWTADMQRLLKLNRELEDLRADYALTAEEVKSDSEMVVNGLNDELKLTIDAVKEQDDLRALFTLDKSKSDPVKLPVFEGKESEDYVEFKDKVERAFIINRVCKADQLAKLRECLRCYPLKLVPESTITKIDDAWEVLDQAFKDPTRVMRFKWNELLRLKYLPKETPKGFKAQIEWYMNLENHIRGIIDVGKRDAELAIEAFGRSKLNTILNMFPLKMRSQLMKCSGQGERRLEAILASIKEFRKEAQEFQIVKETGSDLLPSSYDGSQGFDSGQNSKLSNMSLQVYKPPKKDNNCRICLTLEVEGDTKDLYEDHLHNYATGCPRYIMMSVGERHRIASKARLCLKCHDPKYIYKKFDKQHKCVTDSKRKGKFTCRSCSYHMWVCERHPDDNRAFMHKFKEKYFDDYKLNLGLFVSSQVKPGERSVEVKEDSASISLNQNVLKVSKSKKRKRKKKSCSSSDLCGHKGISSIEATEVLKQKFFDGGEAVHLRPVPEGRAQFIIGQTKGKTRPLNTLYDTGCYAYLMKEGVQHELGPSVLKTRGPFNVTGVGNTAVVVNDEWQTSLPLRDGSRQAVEGWTVNQVTANLPIVDLSMAVKEVKEDKPVDQKLQNLNVQMFGGGDCDILLGLMYTSIFPIPVHSLENGLTIYELQVSSHNPEIDSLIGGPHSSFEYLANHMGGVNILFTQLVDQLEVYKQFGPPKITSPLMSIEDLESANDCKVLDLSQCCERIFDDYETVFDGSVFGVEQSSGSNYEERVDDDPLDQNIYTFADVKCSYDDSQVVSNPVRSIPGEYNLEEIEDNICGADLQCVGCDYLSSDPPAEVAKDCEDAFLACNIGMKRHSKLDLLEVHVKPLPFSSNLWGRLQAEMQLFEGSFRDDYINLQGLKFHRANTPESTVATKMDVMLTGYACDYIKITGIWRSFKLKDGKYSWQLVSGLTFVDDKIPKNELVAMATTSNLDLKVCQFLEKWIKYCIKTGPSQLSVVPMSVWENGYPWICENIDDTNPEKPGINIPIMDVRLNDDNEDNLSYLVLPSLGGEKVKERGFFAMYLILPNKLNFEMTVRIFGYLHRFYNSFKCRGYKFPIDPFVVDLQKFSADIENDSNENEVFDGKRAETFFKRFSPKSHEKFYDSLDDANIWSLRYLFSMIAMYIKGVPASRITVLDVQMFQVADGLEERNTLKLADCPARFLMRVFNVHTTTSRQQMDTFARVIVDSSNSEEAEEAVINASFAQSAVKQIGGGVKFKVVTAKAVTEGEIYRCYLKAQMEDFSMETITAVQFYFFTSHSVVSDAYVTVAHVDNAAELNAPVFGKAPQCLNVVERSWQSCREYEEKIYSSCLLENDNDRFISLMATSRECEWLPHGWKSRRLQPLLTQLMVCGLCSRQSGALTQGEMYL